ncbi:MAG: phytanoyl-CoA dioxygenase family protein [Pseudomonadota bacterium]
MIESIEEEGFCIVRGVLTNDQIEIVRDALTPWLKGDKMGRNNFEGERSERVYAMLAKSPEFAVLVENPRTLPYVEQMLRPNFLLSACLAINVHPGETPQPWHADHVYPGMPRDTLSGISAIIAIDEFTENNGATEVLPGSHRWLDERPVGDDPRRQVMTMAAGSALLLHGALYHRGGANRSDQIRLAVTPQYCQSWLRQLENMTLAVPSDMASGYSPRIQSMLGYNVRDPGFMGYVDGMHPKRLLDADYRGRQARGEHS